MRVRPSIASPLLALLFAFGASAAPPAPAAAGVPGCGPEVTSDGGAIRVEPTGGEDTANLQCALDAAIASGRPTAVVLSEGTFRTAQLVAKGFSGSLQGAGTGATVLTNVPRAVPVTPVDMYLGEPGPQNPWPSLVAFVGGAFRVSDLTVRITGEAPTTGWSIFGIDPPIKAFAHAFVVLGDRATAEFARVELLGAPAPGDLFGLNLVNGVFFEGFLGTNNLAPISGSFRVHDCVARDLASPAPVLNARDADVAITGNRFEGTLLGGEASDLSRARYVFAGNQVDSGWAGVQTYDSCLGGGAVCGLSDASLKVSGNALRSFDGVEIFSTVGPGSSCTVVGNDIEYDAANGGVAVWLGRHTTGCRVVTAGDVLDAGTGNRVVTLP